MIRLAGLPQDFKVTNFNIANTCTGATSKLSWMMILTGCCDDVSTIRFESRVKKRFSNLIIRSELFDLLSAWKNFVPLKYTF